MSGNFRGPGGYFGKDLFLLLLCIFLPTMSKKRKKVKIMEEGIERSMGAVLFDICKRMLYVFAIYTKHVCVCVCV